MISEFDFLKWILRAHKVILENIFRKYILFRNRPWFWKKKIASENFLKNNFQKVKKSEKTVTPSTQIPYNHIINTYLYTPKQPNL